MNASALRAALRIARRDALRAKGRSALVLAMIGLPMLAMAFSDVAVQTSRLSPGERARRDLGGADLVATKVAPGPITQYGFFDFTSEAKPLERDEPPPRPGAVAALVGPGSRVEVRERVQRATVRVPGRARFAGVVRYDMSSPLAEGLARLRSGRVPATPGEAAVTPRLAATLGVRAGREITVGTATFRVTGVVVDPLSLGADSVYLAPGGALPEGARDTEFAVDLPAGVNGLDVKEALNAKGFRAVPRAWYFDPPPEDDSSPSSETIGMAVVAVGLATLEVVLLAGTAFAVGARRQRRALALVAATGGDRKDVRRIVLAGAAVLGATAAAVGIAGGIGLVALLRPVNERRYAGSLMGPLHVRALDMLAIVAVGVGTALLAAALPARAAARQEVVAALTGRRAETRTRLRVPVVALAAIAAGVALAFWAAGDGRVPASGISVAGRAANFRLVLLGAVVAELGFVGCAPSLVGLVGRLGARLPLSFRLAARDAARHRARSGPAVAAIVAAVAGSVALSVFFASQHERALRAYEPALPLGDVRVALPYERDTPGPRLDAVAARLPVRDRIELRGLGSGDCGRGECDEWRMAYPERLRCPIDAVPGDARCDGDEPNGGLAVGDARVVSWVTGRDDPAAADALARGTVVVFDERWVEDGHVTLERGFGTSEPLRLPALVVAGRDFRDAPAAVIGERAARAAHLPIGEPRTAVLTTTRMPTRNEQAEAEAASTPDGRAFFEVYVERGYVANDAVAMLALLGAATAVTIGATGIATGLAAADSRPDLATLAAVGATPSVRRRLVTAQAATVAALGSALGILAGLVPAAAVVAARADLPLVLPWRTLGTTAVGVPLLAAVLMGAFTRSRLPVERRLG